MFTSKFISGINANALKFLLPLWISPFTCITLRFIFGAVAFWIISFCVKKDTATTTKLKLQMLLVGSTGMFLSMSMYTLGLRYTTPISCTILLALIPIWVFILSVIFFKEKFTKFKGIGLTIGLLGAVLSVFFKKTPDIATNPLLGDIFTFISSIMNACYLVCNHIFLKKVSVYSLMKWEFSGAAFSAFIMSLFVKFDAPVFSDPVHTLPLLIMLFVLIFPTIFSFLLVPVGLKYLNTTVVSMYGYVLLSVTTITSLILKQDKFQFLMVVSILLLCGGLFMMEKGLKKEKNDLEKAIHAIDRSVK